MKDDLGKFHAGLDPRHHLIDEDGEMMSDGLPGIRENVHPAQPTEEELREEIVAPGDPHFLPIGVQYQGEWRSHADGLSGAIREQCQALSMYLPVSLTHVHTGGSFLVHELHPDVVREVGYMPELMFRSTAVAVRQIIFLSRDYLRAMILPAAGRITNDEVAERVRKSTIIYTSWERDSVGHALINELLSVGEVWVPCEANCRAFVKSGLPEEMVRVIPHVYNPATHLATRIAWPRGSEVVPSGRRFYHIGKWEPRKGQHALIGAFLQAFTPNDRVSLLIKTHGWGYWDDYPPPEESLEEWIKNEQVLENGWTPKKVKRVLRIMTERVTDAEIAQLHKENNIYVSPSHGEAWDMPAFDALCAGNSLVHVGYGGSEEYAPFATEWCKVVRVEHRMGPVHSGYNWESDANWAEYDLEDLVHAMRQAEPPRRRIHPPEFRRFSRLSVGRQMSELIVERARQVGGEEVAELLENAGSFG
jgi:glycosyltransferase involved in cell wall biosynthesis